jgi:hypothetical protein
VDLDSLRWRTSSFTAEDSCVEVAWWCKSSFSGPEADCVEVGLGVDVVGVRNTKNRGGGQLIVPQIAWQRFCRVVSCGQAATGHR